MIYNPVISLYFITECEMLQICKIVVFLILGIVNHLRFLLKHSGNTETSTENKKWG